MTNGKHYQITAHRLFHLIFPDVIVVFNFFLLQFPIGNHCKALLKSNIQTKNYFLIYIVKTWQPMAGILSLPLSPDLSLNFFWCTNFFGEIPIHEVHRLSWKSFIIESQFVFTKRK